MIAKNIKYIQNQINIVCQKINRDPQEVKILVAVKNRTIEAINQVFKNGIKIIGENRAQELNQKYPYLAKGLRIDFIGHLQKNKVKDVVTKCYLIHSVDSLKLAKEIDKQAGKIGKIQKVLLEINISKEETKYGFKTEELFNIIPSIIELKNIKLMGLMTMVPNFPNSKTARPIFQELKKLKDLLEKKFNLSLLELSMGMSNDYLIAIEEGATIIRLGRGIFDNHKF